ncbi:hypothetical protein KSD_46250 [Ktedonobacter sp. SOSP1-85]|uniref:Lrp/AsnC family transcriptional regulator n=1 Tax=Ktedonobacter sp. SOSP1-85 TaxID=2778367 RepID=UPI001A180DA4|nr:Lrp/AsnC family transcriptional regulator [Ktedonobacter sp. SOSP1-85]GHO76854.1 hypothetical protein KSD_46250 [Ktedonobacter sp. SOSP1-85]
MALETKKPLDETNWQLLEALQQNARLSYSELGQRVGLTAPAVAERMRKMEEQGIIDPSVKPWALALGIEASPLKADRVVGDIPLLTLSTFYTTLEQVFWYRHN